MKLSSRRELLEQSEVELERIRENLLVENPDFLNKFKEKDFFTKQFKEKGKKPSKGFDYERYGHYIYDPDISEIDYESLRKKDSTLPKKDPRTLPIFKDYPWAIEPYMKWLYFSNELGSFANRQNLYYGSKNSKARELLMKKLDPRLLSKSQRIETNPQFNINKLKDELPDSFYQLVSNKEKWSVVIRYLIGKFLWSMQED